MKKISQTELIDKINKASEIISNANVKGSANYVIVSPKIAEAINNLDIRKLRKKKLNKINKINENLL